jgi:hypothetical protein
MTNNRIIYATVQLSIKDNRCDPTNLIEGILDDSTLASGISAVYTGNVNLSSSVSGTWGAGAGQVKIRSDGITEFLRYSGFNTGSGLEISERGVNGSTASAHLAGSVVRVPGWQVPFGVQSASFGTTFNLEDVFQLGQLDAYENVEGIPEIEVAAERVLDGTKPFWLMVSDPDFTDLKGRTSDFRADFALSVYPDTQSSAIGTPDSTVVASGMFVSAWSASLPADGNFTESITLVGNDKSWGLEEGVPSGIFGTSDAYDARVVGSGVQRSEDYDPTNSTLPADIPSFDHIQSIEVSVDITREEIFELGQKTPFFRAVSFPIEVTSTFETITDKGDLVNAKGDGSDNLVNRTIIIKTKGGLRINLGTKNKLSSVNFDGFDAGGGNGTVQFEYTNSNALTITHDQFTDPFKTNVDLPGFSLSS